MTILEGIAAQIKDLCFIFL